MEEIETQPELTFHAPEAVNVEHTTPAQKFIFKIEGMCCPTEVETLKGVLGPVVNREGREADLIFDLINAKLMVESKVGNLPNNEEIIKAVKKAGMKATLWEEHVKQAQEKKTFWGSYGRLSLNLLSATCLVSGVVVHAINDGALAAFGIGGDENTRPENPPIASMALYSAAIAAGSAYIVPKAIRALRNLRLDTNTLMIAATAGAIGINHWFEAASSMYLFSAAEILEDWNMARARNAIRALMELTPSTAQVVDEDGDITEQLVADIPIGTTITVRPGEKIPMDSVLISGVASVNQSPITGESMPIQKEVGDPLFAGTINEDSVIQCRVTKPDSDSTLASIIRKVEEAQSHRAKSEQFIEKFAKYYVPTMITASLAVSIIPPLATSSSWYPWVYKGLELLVISCPCSLIISTPVSITAGITAAARSGILIKGGVHLENAAHIEAFAMDKTGTLTTGAPIVQNIIPLNDYNTERLLKVASALEIHSDHPLARAIQRKAKEDGIINQPAESFQLFKGKGGEGYIDGELFWIGSPRFLHEKVGDNETTAVDERIQELEAEGHSIVAIGTGQNICGLISIADAVRPESKQAIQALKKQNVKSVVMLTGDNKGAANTIANSIGIDEYYSELLPEDKVHQIEALMKKYKRVAMVGDGVNDAPAMAASSLGIAMGAAGSDAAIETADIALMSDDLGKLAWLVNHSHRTLNIIKQNIGFSLLVKSAFVGLTFANKSTLWMALLSDMGTSFIVVSNGLRLLNNKAEATTQRQSILPVGSESISILIDSQEEDPSLLSQEQNYSPIYESTTTAQNIGGLTPSLGKKECKDCKKDCKSKGKVVVQPYVALEDESDTFL
ncbi:MAG: heavy metal translocating P-type ATPase [Alphaproteobacteria bacterium]|nr:heavy metal translocating P-type ATPase [Alphaproteobacteria bacterium]